MEPPFSEKDIARILEQDGPLTGAELVERTRMDPLPLWRACRSSADIHFEVIGRRFLRLDRAVEGYARLSPSIRREFLTYTLLSLKRRPGPARTRAARLRRETAEISRAKLVLAREAMQDTVSGLAEGGAILAQACFLIAGDITYGMSHTVPRPEKSTGKMVRGSDLDIIVICTDTLPEDAFTALDTAIYRKKHFLLVHPEYREEIDYILKRMSNVRKQLAFDGFRSMVACKIMYEGRYLYGSKELFREIKKKIRDHGIPERIAALKSQAETTRHLTEDALRQMDPEEPEKKSGNLFYTSEEGDEIY